MDKPNVPRRSETATTRLLSQLWHIELGSGLSLRSRLHSYSAFVPEFGKRDPTSLEAIQEQQFSKQCYEDIEDREKKGYQIQHVTSTQ